MKYAVKYDAFGEYPVTVFDDGTMEEIDPQIRQVERLSPELDSVVGAIWAICKDLNNRGRTVPPTKSELQNFFNWKTIRLLSRLGVLKEATIALADKNGKNPGSRSCVLLTNYGRAYCKSYFEEAEVKNEEISSVT